MKKQVREFVGTWRATSEEVSASVGTWRAMSNRAAENTVVFSQTWHATSLHLPTIIFAR
ncbi:MAG: hypothetical protein HDS16_08960 [Bacteroides sp.]|nr:hypothetical protein [Bacteroidales bacterium]MBD5303104.1 hypothetical protein [Bacteroides sp.]